MEQLLVDHLEAVLIIAAWAVGVIVHAVWMRFEQNAQRKRSEEMFTHLESEIARGQKAFQDWRKEHDRHTDNVLKAQGQTNERLAEGGAMLKAHDRDIERLKQKVYNGRDK